MDTEKLLALIRQAVRAELGESKATVVNFTEAARMLSVSTKHVSRMVRRGSLLVVNIDGARRIPVSEIHRLSFAPETTPQPPPPRAPKYSAAAAEAELARLEKKRR
jgi:hypothetical protein